MGYVKVDTINNLISCLIGAIIFILCGLYTTAMLKALNRADVNAMFLKAPYEKIPFFNFYTISIIGVVILLSITTLYEKKFYPVEKVWYNRLRNKNNKQIEGNENNA